MNTVLDVLTGSGLWNVPVAVVAALVFTFAGERARVLVLTLDGDGRTLLAQLQKMVMADDLDGAMRLCMAEPNTACARVARAALARRPKGDAEVVRAVEEARLEVMAQLHRREGVLLGLALLSVSVGFMGTVFGIATTFRAAPEGSVEARGYLPLGAMADDLGCAALGLAVAALAVSAHLALGSVRNKVALELDLFAVKLRNLLVMSRPSAVAVSAEAAQPARLG